MLRVGLTGELGSGKSTVARMLADRGAVVLSSDEMAREMMQPGHAVYTQIVERFGKEMLTGDGTLDRRALSAAAFDPQNPRVEELNAIIHPAVITEQARAVAEIAKAQPHAIVVIESALIFSTRYSRGWRERFDCLVLVTAPDEVKLERFVARVAHGKMLSTEQHRELRDDARQRLIAQRIETPSGLALLHVDNEGGIDELDSRVDALWKQLVAIEITHEF